MSETPLKQCSNKSECVHPDAVDGWLPATVDYFRYRKEKRQLTSRCKSCEAASYRRWRQNNLEQVREARKQTYLANKDKELAWMIAWRTNNRKHIKEYTKAYYTAHCVELRAKSRDWRRRNPQKRRLQDKRYRERRDKYLAREAIRLRMTRRRARKRNLPDNLTAEQWQRALDYFNGCCAVCGRQLRDLFATHTAAADHWIPLASPDCPGTIAENMLPLCHGENGCNNSKSNKPARKWLVKRFGKRRAAQILARVEAYFEWVRRQDED